MTGTKEAQGKGHWFVFPFLALCPTVDLGPAAIVKAIGKFTAGLDIRWVTTSFLTDTRDGCSWGYDELSGINRGPP